MVKRFLTSVIALAATGAGITAPVDTPANTYVSKLPPQRIVSLNLCTDQLLILLARRERIAGVTRLAPLHESSALAEQAQGLPTVTGSAEEVVALKPDLVLAGTYTTRYTTKMLRAFDIPVLTFPGAEDFHEVRRQIREVAGALHEPARGEEIIHQFDTRLAALAQSPARRAVFYRAGGYSSGAGTLIDAVFSAAKINNAAASAGLQGAGYLPLERIVYERPQWLITTLYRGKSPTAGMRVLQHPALQSIPKGEYILPQNLTACGGVWNADAAALLSHLGEAP